VKKVRVGLVGVGRIGRLHVETLRQRVPQAELVVLTDRHLEEARAVAAEFEVPRVADSFEAMLSDSSLEAVVICSSTDTHALFISAAARAGKHIFCEKPIDPDLARIDAVLEDVRAAGVKLMIGFNRRFDANPQRIKRALETGEVGTPHILSIISRDPAPPPLEYIRVSGGMFLDMTIHDFDMARFLMGEVEEVFTHAAVLVDPLIGEAGDVDTAIINLKFKSGALGVIDNSRQAVYGYDQRIEVLGSLGSLRSENLFPDTVRVSTAQAVKRGRPYLFFMDRYLKSYQAELTAFIDAVAYDQPVPVTGEDGRAPVVLARAALQSLAEGRAIRL